MKYITLINEFLLNILTTKTKIKTNDKDSKFWNLKNSLSLTDRRNLSKWQLKHGIRTV